MAGWSKRTTFNSGNGNRRTFTQNTNKGNTFSSSQKVGSMTYTTTQLPNGKIKYTRTYHQGGYTKRETSTSGGVKRVKSYKPRKIRSRKMTKAEAQMWAALFSSKWFWLTAFIIFVIMSAKH